MKNLTLALCIPAYNAASFLPRLLKSAVAQTVPFDEIWVYDDCSSDNTGDIAKEFGAKVVHGDINRGCSYGKNVLAEKTSCEWLHFHDADDELYPNFVEQARKWMVLENPPDVVLSNYEWRDNDTKKLLNIRNFDDEALAQDPIAYTIKEQINPFCGLYLRESYLRAGGYDTDPLVLYNEDDAFHCRLARAGLKFRSDSTITVINYYRSNSMHKANLLKCARAKYHVLRESAEALGDKYNLEISEKLWGTAGVSGSYLDWDNADNCVKLAMELTGRIPVNSSALFKFLCMINPYLVIRVREYCIRFLKPQLRP
ncbi:glycosyltransferase family 2 protein [Nodularia spumigena]|uniref:glycosyltransferase family 2 protein n=1 Tax=Nodularia spumigena TaxID=70799 RepID=UPI00232AC670|nr:glycosyltransferase family 2 protein [Nodularia spumigena]MDB9347424.1 glycosyltransferase family 2 protein [Nodularia spumigena CS-588/01]MDB9354470.1 glycosyltransferase family 2 protein [Nodularia spumigena CS-588/05]